MACQHRTAPLPHVDSDLAFFLTVRGPYWWIGYGEGRWVGTGAVCVSRPASTSHPASHTPPAPPRPGWVGCSVPYDYPAALQTDVGLPLGTCSETAPGSGVFTRAWTKATSKVDCNSLSGSIELHE